LGDDDADDASPEGRETASYSPSVASGRSRRGGGRGREGKWEESAWSPCSSGQVRVLFLHGLEGGPESFKAQWMRDHEGFHVVARDMDVSLTALVGKANSVAAHCVIHERTIAWACLPFLVAGVVVAALDPLLGMGGYHRFWRATIRGETAAAPALALVAVLAWLLLLKVQARQILGSAVARVLARCVAIQSEVLRNGSGEGISSGIQGLDEAGEFVPDVVVGSSFGGAVALLLVLAGEWKGPTVLLAPAWGRLARYAGARELGRALGLQQRKGWGWWRREGAPWSWHDELARVPAEVAGKIAIYHGAADKTCPLDDSKVLVAANPNIRLTVMPKAGHRGCNRLFQDGTIGRLLRDKEFMCKSIAPGQSHEPKKTR